MGGHPLPPRRYRPETARLLEQEEQRAELAATHAALEARLGELLALEVGWDSYEGRPLSEEAAALARRLLADLVDEPAKAPQLVPGSDGGLQLEWHQAGYDLEISVSGAGCVEVWLCQPDGAEQEGRLSQRMRRLIAAALNAIAAAEDDKQPAPAPAPTYAVWCAETNNLLAEVATAEEAIGICKHDPENLVAFSPTSGGQPAAVIYDERDQTRTSRSRQPIQYESEVVTMADGERSLVLHELPQLFRRSVVEQAIDALEHADLILEQLLEEAGEGAIREPLVKRGRRLRRHKLERAITELRREAGWDSEEPQR